MGWNILNPNDQNVLDALQSKFYVVVKSRSYMENKIWSIVDVSRTMTLEEANNCGVFMNSYAKKTIQRWDDLPEDWKNRINDWDGQS